MQEQADGEPDHGQAVSLRELRHQTELRPDSPAVSTADADAEAPARSELLRALIKPHPLHLCSRLHRNFAFRPGIAEPCQSGHVRNRPGFQPAGMELHARFEGEQPAAGRSARNHAATSMIVAGKRPTGGHGQSAVNQARRYRARPKPLPLADSAAPQARATTQTGHFRRACPDLGRRQLLQAMHHLQGCRRKPSVPTWNVPRSHGAPPFAETKRAQGALTRDPVPPVFSSAVTQSQGIPKQHKGCCAPEMPQLHGRCEAGRPARLSEDRGCGASWRRRNGRATRPAQSLPGAMARPRRQTERPGRRAFPRAWDSDKQSPRPF